LDFRATRGTMTLSSLFGPDSPVGSPGRLRAPALSGDRIGTPRLVPADRLKRSLRGAANDRRQDRFAHERIG
jgi:hypothetical protein